MLYWIEGPYKFDINFQSWLDSAWEGLLKE